MNHNQGYGAGVHWMNPDQSVSQGGNCVCMRTVAGTVLCVFIQMLSSCGWSGSQQDVVDAWDQASAALSEDSWEQSWPLLSPGTRMYLDSAAVELRRMGAQGCSSGLDLLAMTFHEYFNLAGEVTLILNHGDSVMLEISGSEGTVSRWMVRDSDRWVIDLEQPYRDSISSAFQGAYMEPSLIVPEPAGNAGGTD
jgi:hypothetical protein